MSIKNGVIELRAVVDAEIAKTSAKIAKHASKGRLPMAARHGHDLQTLGILRELLNVAIRGGEREFTDKQQREIISFLDRPAFCVGGTSIAYTSHKRTYKELRKLL